jgi:hypothetical protein
MADRGSSLARRNHGYSTDSKEVPPPGSGPMRAIDAVKIDCEKTRIVKQKETRFRYANTENHQT